MYILVPLILAACSLIDDDLSVCAEDVTLVYQLQLHTEVSVQLQTELAAVLEQPVRHALEQWLKPVFGGEELAVDLRFFSLETDELRHRMQELLRDDHRRYTVTLPKENYMHLAVARTDSNSQVSTFQGEHSASMELQLPEQPNLPSLNAGVFTARLPIEVTDSVREIDVNLYMVDAAVALVIDTVSCVDLRDMNAYMTGSANSFSVLDSTYSYTVSPNIWFERVPLSGQSASPVRCTVRKEDSPYTCMAVIGMPTADNQEWSIRFTSTLTYNRHTATTLTVSEPLTAGALKIIKLQMNADGELTPVGNSEVGATVELDWSKGGDHEVEL